MTRYLILLSSFFLFGCQTTHLKTGTQSSYAAVNPASIIAVPILTIPNPAKATSSIDLATISSEQIIPQIEKKVISSFEGQPHINGYPFSVVKNAIETEKPSILDGLNKTMHSVANRFSSRDIKERLLITSQCSRRSNFIEFYSYCLANDSNWIDSLNALSARVLNSDSALFIVIDNLNTQIHKDQYEITASVAVLLIDTNNGKLIWANEKTVTKSSLQNQKTLPSWSALIDEIFTQDFWNEFPGRIHEAKHV